MRVEVTYYADDDTEFASREECEAYEKAQSQMMDAVAFFDDNCQRMETMQDIERYATYILILDDHKAEETFVFVEAYIGQTMPRFEVHNGDVLYWNGEFSSSWENLEKKAEQIFETVGKIRKAGKK